MSGAALLKRIEEDTLRPLTPVEIHDVLPCMNPQSTHSPAAAPKSITAGHWLIVVAVLLSGVIAGLLSSQPWKAEPAKPQPANSGVEFVANFENHPNGLVRCYGNETALSCLYVPRP